MKTVSLGRRDIQYIVFRNVFLLTNGIIFAVVIFLFAFGNTVAGIFLGTIIILNISLGLAQDIRAWLALQKLQLLTAPSVTRILPNSSEESVLVEDVAKGDIIKLKIGDQVPCDSILTDAKNFEINEGLITGESNSMVRKKGDRVLAGSLVTSGSGTINIETAFHESRIARMTEGIKTYSLNASPIQREIGKVIAFFGYVLIGALVFTIGRGILIGESAVQTVLDVGALTSMLVPQGLVFTVTLFFAYGAANLFRKQVLLQEVNATEKLGRIKNLCMDKTGTLTENKLSVKEILAPAGISEEMAMKLSDGYIKGTGDSSQTVEAIKVFLHQKNEIFGGQIIDALPFSSWRQYGSARLKNIGFGENPDGERVIFAGPPQIFSARIENTEEKNWFEKIILDRMNKGERVLCFMQSKKSIALDGVSEANLSVLAVFVFHSALREGIRQTIDFFQNRGVHIRIISGDNPEAASAIAESAGINDSKKVITGEELKNWSETDYVEKVKSYSIFASILPEQKKQIVEAFKKDGFTAMIGDGANDALAIKSADLGIAMFDGAPAVRSLASVVLTNNSFSALPGGVRLADNIIRYIEVFASIFINQTIIGLLFFIVVSAVNHGYPLTPFNITLINYFTVGIPSLLISYWVIRPRNEARTISTKPFLKRVIPFAFTSAIFQTIAVTIAFFASFKYMPEAEPNTFVSLAFIAVGLIFLMFVPKVYQGNMPRRQKIQLLSFILCELIILAILFHVSALTLFFNVVLPQFSYTAILWVLLALSPFTLIQYLIARYFAKIN